LSTAAPGAARQRHRRHGTPQSHAGRQPATCIARACWVPNSLVSVSRRASTTRYDRMARSICIAVRLGRSTASCSSEWRLGSGGHAVVCRNS